MTITVSLCDCCHREVETRKFRTMDSWHEAYYSYSADVCRECAKALEEACVEIVGVNHANPERLALESKPAHKLWHMDKKK